MTTAAFGRIAAAGANVERIARTAVLVKVGNVPADRLWRHPAWPLCRALTAVGFGAVHLRGALDYFDDLAALMSTARFSQEPGLWFGPAVLDEAPAADIIVDLTNDPLSKSLCAQLSDRRSSLFLSLSWGRAWVSLTSTPGPDAIADDLAATVRPEMEPLLPIARIAAGLALQECVMAAGEVELAAPLAAEVTYNAATESRTGREDGSAWRDVQVDDAVVDVIGVGGIGIHLSEVLAPLLGRNCQLRLSDPDFVADENLPSQIAYAQQDIGQPKVLAMAERLLSMCGSRVALWPFAVRYQECPRDLARPTLRVSCPDNWAARKYANDLALADGVPLIDGGSAPLAAQVRTYCPGRTACLEHQIPMLAQKVAAERDAASCGRNRALTLPGTNAVCGGLLAVEAIRALRPECGRGLAPSGVVYDARHPARFGIVGSRPPCSHATA